MPPFTLDTLLVTMPGKAMTIATISTWMQTNGIAPQ